MTKDYCPNGCTHGWIETESKFGTVCAIHPPNEPQLMQPGDSDPVARLRPRNYGEYLRSDEWKRRRRHALERADHRCQTCGWKYGDVGPKRAHLQVHHQTYERLGCEEPTDLLVLCLMCHGVLHQELAKYNGEGVA